MSYYIFIKNNKLDGCGQCKQLTDSVISLNVDESLFNDYMLNPNKYIWNNGIEVNDKYELQVQYDTIQGNVLKIKDELKEVDLATIRPLRANEVDILSTLENKAEQLREQLHKLEEELERIKDGLQG